MFYQTKHRVVDAIQFTGVASLPAVQSWMSPQSPMYGGKLNALTITVRDRHNDVLYPSIAPNYTTKTIEAGSWILREEDGEFAVMTNAEFGERFEPVGQGMVDAVERAEASQVEPPLPVDVLGEGAVPGDDVDPTGVVDTSHVQDRAGQWADSNRLADEKVGGTSSDDESVF